MWSSNSFISRLLVRGGFDASEFALRLEGGLPDGTLGSSSRAVNSKEPAHDSALVKKAYAAAITETGKFLGIPFDWRRPTLARVKQRWWNPSDPRFLG
jgi:hypothetical protein